jgi:hypothetical protein
MHYDDLSRPFDSFLYFPVELSNSFANRPFSLSDILTTDSQGICVLYTEEEEHSLTVFVHKDSIQSLLQSVYQHNTEPYELSKHDPTDDHNHYSICITRNQIRIDYAICLCS